MQCVENFVVLYTILTQLFNSICVYLVCWSVWRRKFLQKLQRQRPSTGHVLSTLWKVESTIVTMLKKMFVWKHGLLINYSKSVHYLWNRRNIYNTKNRLDDWPWHDANNTLEEYISSLNLALDFNSFLFINIWLMHNILISYVWIYYIYIQHNHI